MTDQITTFLKYLRCSLRTFLLCQFDLARKMDNPLDQNAFNSQSLCSASERQHRKGASAITQVVNGCVGGQFRVAKGLGACLSSHDFFVETLSLDKRNCISSSIDSANIRGERILTLKNLADFKRRVFSVQTVISHHNYDIASIQLMIFSKLVLKKRLLCIFHSYFDFRRERHFLAKVAAVIRKLTLVNLGLLFADRLIFITKSQMLSYRTFVFTKRYFDKRAVVIPNSIEEQLILKTRIHPVGQVINVLFVGRLTRMKGIDDLEKLMNQTLDAGFFYHLVGPGKSIVDRPHQYLYGEIDPGDIIRIYDQCEILILPSYTEVLPMVILEAMARGLVILVSDIPGIREVVKEGRNGFFFPPGDVRKMKEILKHLKEHPEVIAEIRQNNLVDVRFLIDNKQISKYVSILNDICKQ